jgi:hypothetical protein
MARFLIAISILLVGSGCAYTGDRDRNDVEFTRIEYFETVFLPASEACRRAGGFMIFEDPTDTAVRGGALSYPDMRLAMARGCAGI